MKQSTCKWALVVTVFFSVAVLFAADNPDSTTIGTLTVEGLVRDIACPLQNKKSTSTSYSKECITMCLKSGSPLGILTSDGDVYVPVTESMPDTGQNTLKPRARCSSGTARMPSKSAKYINSRTRLLANRRSQG
jgi:hypothetical protein